MNFDFEPSGSEYRPQLREFLERNLPDELKGREFERLHHAEFYRKLVLWARENLGGHALFELDVVREEAARVGFSIFDYDLGANIIAATLAEFGSDEQRAEVLPGMQSGEFLICLGYSEPDSGSDIAAARTRAVRDGDTWVINGQKMFTSNAERATHVFLLTRTDTSVPKHAGLTMFLVPMDSPGIEVRTIKTLAYHPTNMTFYTDLVVPDTMRVGPVNAGWSVLRYALSVEQTGSTTGLNRRLVEAAIDWARNASHPEHGRVINDPIARQRLARAVLEDELCTLLGQRLAATRYAGKPLPEGWAPGSKLFQSESYDSVTNDLLSLAAPDSLLPFEQEGAIASGWFNYAYRDAPVKRIAGGSNEILRDIIAERRLGLPRSRPVSTRTEAKE